MSRRDNSKDRIGFDKWRHGRARRFNSGGWLGCDVVRNTSGTLWLGAYFTGAFLAQFGLAAFTLGIEGAAHIIGTIAGLTYAAAAIYFQFNIDYQTCVKS